MKTNIILLILTTIIFSCRGESKDKFTVIKNKKVQYNLRKYENYENRFIKSVKEKKLDLQRIYSDSSNYYDSLVNVDINKLSQQELYHFNDIIKDIKINKIKSLKEKK